MPTQGKPQHDRPTAIVIAQHYSSATFVLLRFHSLKEKFGTRLKNCGPRIVYVFVYLVHD